MAQTDLNITGGTQVGDVRTFTATFTDGTDPVAITLSDVTWYYKAPGVAYATYVSTDDEVTAGTTGQSKLKVRNAVPGKHFVSAEWRSGVNGAAISGEFTVDPDLARDPSP